MKKNSNSLFSLNDYFDDISTNATTAVNSTTISPSNSYQNVNDPLASEASTQTSTSDEVGGGSDNWGKNIILLVGLPATGKSTISKKLMEFLNLNTKIKTKIFNCGDKRRQTFKKFNNYEFFDPLNEISKLKRDFIAIESLNLIINELNSHTINLGILDATNTTIERRNNLINVIYNSAEIHDLDNLIILDIQNNNPKLINFNIFEKSFNDDYKKFEINKSIEDFTKRLGNYRKAYEPISDDELVNYSHKGLSSYIKIENGGSNYIFKHLGNHKIDNANEKVDNDNGKVEFDLMKIIEKFFIDYSSNETKKYFEKVDNFYKNNELINQSS